MSQMITDEELAAAEAESAVLQLPKEHRARIAARLLESLEEETRVEQAWAAEIRERIRAFRAGEMKAIPLEQALEEAEELLR
ncbi:MAG TPA: addiction module protein [Longimicrobium sp.]|jgi:putative addiction module component (TIGR02574 family)|uniref:addiction module protein n=1 Tax=Longimicrobium sp. TaxID=2029185 RepID=UPI002ED7DA02